MLLCSSCSVVCCLAALFVSAVLAPAYSPEALVVVAATRSSVMIQLHQSVLLTGHRFSHYFAPCCSRLTGGRKVPLVLSMERPVQSGEKLSASHFTGTPSALVCEASLGAHEVSPRLLLSGILFLIICLNDFCKCE